eukprot:5264934-Prymnesium_polylepis.1
MTTLCTVRPCRAVGLQAPTRSAVHVCTRDRVAGARGRRQAGELAQDADGVAAAQAGRQADQGGLADGRRWAAARRRRRRRRRSRSRGGAAQAGARWCARGGAEEEADRGERRVGGGGLGRRRRLGGGGG